MTTFAPDSALVDRVLPSPNHNERRGGARADVLLLHYTGMQSTKAALARLCDARSEVSCHYLIDEAGAVAQLVPEARRAWHAGVAAWEASSDINSRSIGVEIANPGHDFGYPDFCEAQIVSLIALCRDIVARHAIRADRVLAHSDVAPTRKRDPGEKFPWRRLHEAGIGLWVPAAPITAGPVLARGARGSEVARLRRALAGYGYGLAAEETYDALTADVVAAFQRHFRPQQVDGVADRSTVLTLAALRSARRAGDAPTA